jgi:hypothetical protein
MPPESRRRFKAAAIVLLEAREAEALIFTKVDRATSGEQPSQWLADRGQPT